MSKKKLVYIGGWGRSGTTLISSLLACSLKSVFVGEMRYLWDRALTNDSVCGCGQPSSKCSLWCGLKDSVLADEKDYDELVKRSLFSVGSRARPKQFWTFFPVIRNLYFRKYKAELKLLNECYDYILESSEKNIVIDSSKSPFYFSSLLKLEGYELHFVHVIRDPKGVCASWKKNKVTGDDLEGKVKFPKYSIFRSCAQWTFVNFACLLFRNKKNVNYIQVKYEDFAREPEVVLDSIVHDIGEERVVSEPYVHSISGNPIRFENLKELEIKPDIAWIKILGYWEKTLINLAAKPFFLLSRK